MTLGGVISAGRVGGMGGRRSCRRRAAGWRMRSTATYCRMPAGTARTIPATGPTPQRSGASSAASCIQVHGALKLQGRSVGTVRAGHGRDYW